MPTVIVRLPVEDFDTWFVEYEAMHTARAQFGDLGRTLYRDVDDPNVVVVVFDWDTIENAKRYFESDDLKASVGRARASAPEVFYLAAF